MVPLCRSALHSHAISFPSLEFGAAVLAIGPQNGVPSVQLRCRDVCYISLVLPRHCEFRTLSPPLRSLRGPLGRGLTVILGEREACVSLLRYNNLVAVAGETTLRRNF